MLKALTKTESIVPDMHTKCGEIYYQKSQWYFLCVLCGNGVKRIEEFQSHFESLHLTEFMEMIVRPINVPFLDEESLTSVNVNSIVTKADDPLHYENRCSVREKCGNNTVTFNNENGQTKNLDNVNLYTDLVNDVQTKEFENFINCSITNCIEKIEISNDKKIIESYSYDENSIDLENISGDVTSDNDSKINWNMPFKTDHLNTCEKRPYKPRNKAFSCTYCGRTFRRRYQFDTHLNIHTGAKPHQCDICGRQFRAVTTLQRHLSTHKQRNFVCNYCDKCFTHKVALLSHETRHTQERNEPCDRCEKRFYTVNQLNTHKRRVHKESTDILSFACDLCPNRYRTASMLSTHKCRKHYKTAKFQCEQCNKKFVDIQRLGEHQKIHVEGKVSSQYVDVKKKS